ncbi:MAG: hypothetical protein KatS3mg088_562 [Patescibacteria group bacterium]|nr:MAG: hypothetical protein KatS3mg088_562 [Patescibacteria group bacterium]
MRKLILIIYLVITIFLIYGNFPSIVFSQSSFSVDSFITYDVDENGDANVVQDITLTNEVAEVYAKSYTVSLANFKPEYVKAESGGTEIPVRKEENGNKTSLSLDFPDIKVGKGASRNFKLTYRIREFAQKTGEVWELYLPYQTDIENFKNYRLTLFVPISFGNLAYSSPEPEKKFTQGNKNGFEFTKERLKNSGVNLGFGNFQIFSFTLIYHLENPLEKEAITKIALPPDGSFQRVFYKEIDPKPIKIGVDNDGNWLADYRLQPRERLEVKAIGYAQIFPYPQKIRDFDKEILYKNTLPQKYWESDSPEIKRIAQNLRSIKEVYDYVVNILNYDYDRAKPNVQRLGAKAALENPNSAICMEFTDLFVAILRAKGIPAREINGYAYTENPKLMPLSLVNDVLHSWPEYWDESKKIWVPVDPTWQKTNVQADFFEKQDLRHFAFVIHGESSTYPPSAGSYKLGYQPQKDVFITLGGQPELVNNQISTDVQIITNIPLISYKARINIKNEGQSAIYNQKVLVLFDQDEVKEEKIAYLLPFSNYEFEVNIPFSFLAQKTPYKISIISVNIKKEVKGVKEQVLLANILVIFALVILLMIFIIIKFNKINFQIILSKFYIHRKQ